MPLYHVDTTSSNLIWSVNMDAYSFANLLQTFYTDILLKGSYNIIWWIRVVQPVSKCHDNSSTCSCTGNVNRKINISFYDYKLQILHTSVMKLSRNDDIYSCTYSYQLMYDEFFRTKQHCFKILRTLIFFIKLILLILDKI